MKKKITLTAISLFTSAVMLTASSAYTFEWPAISTTVKNNEIKFSAVQGLNFTLNSTQLEDKLNIPKGSLAGITLTQLPTDGDLYLGLSKITENTALSREDIDNLRIVFTEDKTTLDFSFLPDCNEAIPTIAVVNLLETANKAPETESGKLSVLKNIPSVGKITAYDADGDKVMVQIVNKPDKGRLTIDGLCFKYSPYKDKTGYDKFTFIIIDEYGNQSRESLIDINIEKDVKFSYSDMLDNSHHFAAIKLSEKGIYTSDKIGDKYYFNPDSLMTRGDFIMLIVTAMGLDISYCVNTGLDNDSEIPMYLKPYVKAAIDAKVITETYFMFNENPLNCEAVVLAHRISAIPEVVHFNLSASDIHTIPDWSLGSYMTLCAYKILDIYDNVYRPMEGLRKDTAVGLAWQLWKYKDSIE